MGNENNNTPQESSSKSEDVQDKVGEAEKEAGSFGSTEPTDGRNRYEWKSKYPDDAALIIKKEAWSLVALFFFALLMILFTWCGVIEKLLGICCDITSGVSLRQYIYVSFSGLLAGTIYSMKYLYHAVARGLWHLDRQLWRFMSPLISLGVAFIVGALIHTDMLGGEDPITSSASLVSIGFIAGYFSDTAIAKMYEIANVLFGTSNKNTPK